MDEFIKKTVQVNIVFVVGVTSVLLGLGRVPWAIGFLLGSMWSTTNFLFTLNLGQALLSQKSKIKTFLIFLIKFPLLYFIGFLLLYSQVFPVSSLLAGVTTILVVLSGMKLWPKNT